MSEQRSINITLQGRKQTFIYELGPGTDPFWLDGLKDSICDPDVMQVMGRAVWPGDTVVDGGACFGYFTVLLSKLVGPSGKVIAVEPGPNNLLWLYRNLEHNDCKNVTVIEQPLWQVPRKVTMHIAENGGTNSIADGWGEPTEQTATTLGRFTPARLVKLDIEGAEEAALTTVAGPQDVPFVITELNEYRLRQLGSSQISLRTMMYERGYQTFLISNDGTMPVLVPSVTTLACSRANVNILFSTIDAVGRIWNLIAV